MPDAVGYTAMARGSKADKWFAVRGHGTSVQRGYRPSEREVNATIPHRRGPWRYSGRKWRRTSRSSRRDSCLKIRQHGSRRTRTCFRLGRFLPVQRQHRIAKKSGVTGVSEQAARDDLAIKYGTIRMAMCFTDPDHHQAQAPAQRERIIQQKASGPGSGCFFNYIYICYSLTVFHRVYCVRSSVPAEGAPCRVCQCFPDRDRLTS